MHYWLPPDLAWWQVAAVLLLAGLSGFFKSAFGISGALIVPLMLFVAPAKLVVGAVGPVNLVTDLLALRHHWRRWAVRDVLALVPASLVGTVLGVWYLVHVSLVVLERTIALIAIAYGAVQIWQSWRSHRRPAAEVAAAAEGRRPARYGPGLIGAGLAAGLVGGTLSSIAHTGGLVLTFYLLGVGLQKEAYVATLVMAFLFQDISKNLLYGLTGILTWQILGLALLSLPLLFLGSAVGARLVRRLSVAQFSWAISVLVLLAGVALLVR